jgi:hypothetical protein
MFAKLLLGATASLFIASSALAQDTPASRMLTRIASLEGEWEGSYQWSGARSGGGDLRVVYQVTGMGSAVIETMIQGGRNSMSSVYHLDGADLRMTHYCATRKQSRLRATPDRISANVATFNFVDVTNADPARPGYVTGFDMTVVDDDHIINHFIFEGGAPQATETITLHRVSRAHQQPPAAQNGSDTHQH